MAKFTNQASLTYNGTTVSSNTVTGEITEILSVSKDVYYVNTYHPGDTITYVINLKNTGKSDLDNLTLTENLGVYQTAGGTDLIPLNFVTGSVSYYADGVKQGTPQVEAVGNTIEIKNLSVAGYKSSQIIYDATVNEFGPLGDREKITNTVSVNGGGISAAVEASATINFDTAANITLTKNLSPGTVVENGEVIYTFTLENTGAEANAAANVAIEDLFSPKLQNISVRVDGTLWPPTEPDGAGGTLTNYTYTEGEYSGTFATTAGRITVPAAQYAQDPVSNEWTLTPGVKVITVTGTI